MTLPKILITGAAGNIGRYLTERLGGQYNLRLTDIRPLEERGEHPFVMADIADLDSMRSLCQGIDVVIHLAADIRMSAPWESLLPNNIIGLYNVFQAAHEAGCRRVIFASSVNAVAGYPPDVQVHTHMPVRPLNLYGASKVWGEAVGCFYADQLGLSVICLRFGWVVARDNPAIRPDHPFLDMVITLPDMAHLVERCLEAPDDLRFGIFHGISDNRWKRMDISDAREQLGYRPQDDAHAIAGIGREQMSGL